MHQPLPGRKADELIEHVRSCPTCYTARAFLRPLCAAGRRLVVETTKERHGER
jgi:hypothetical protein